MNKEQLLKLLDEMKSELVELYNLKRKEEKDFIRAKMLDSAYNRLGYADGLSYSISVICDVERCVKDNLAWERTHYNV